MTELDKRLKQQSILLIVKNEDYINGKQVMEIKSNGVMVGFIDKEGTKWVEFLPVDEFHDIVLKETFDKVVTKI